MDAPRPPRPRWQLFALVAAGGTLGAAAREGLSLAIPPLGGLPVAILLINVVGALLLGYLLESLTQRGTEPHRAGSLRALLGTGFCGGFTTYSALAVDTVLLGNSGQFGLAVAYALGTVVIGACATWAGIALGAALNSGPADAAAGAPETAAGAANS